MSATNPVPPRLPRAFHTMAKPIGPICNLDCKYCYYLEKENLFPSTERFRMSEPVLEAFVKQYIEAQDVPEVTFAWQGGEPTLLGLDFFRRVVKLQKKYAGGKKISNTLQTNGTLLNDAFCSFFSDHGFLIGISIDGPRDLHNKYRVDKRGRPSFDDVMQGISLLQKHRTEFNTLIVVNRITAEKPLEIYGFLKRIGSGFMQFIPIVERRPAAEARDLGLDLDQPPELVGPGEETQITSWSVRPEQYGAFLVTIFDAWVRRDVGRYFVQMFDVALANWFGAGGSLCLFSERCGDALVVEHNGDLFSCDHFVYPRYRLGNILNRTMAEMAFSAEQRRFGDQKAATLPRVCRECPVRFACNGECPKHRFLKTPDGEMGLNYLCAAYKRFFTHIDPYMREMARLIRSGRTAADIMRMTARESGRTGRATAGGNQRCPCGSGRKYKNCCGA